MKIKIHFIKVVTLIKLIYFWGNDCLSLELKDYKTICSKIILKKKTFIIGFAYLIWTV